MADFAEIGEIISRCMGHANDEFLDAYYKNIELQVEEAIEAHPIGTALVILMESRVEWFGTATELLAKLEDVAAENRINIHDKLWPKTPNWLSRRINEVRTNLREKGITIDKNTSDNSNKELIIRKTQENTENSKLSILSYISTASQNYAQNRVDSTVDTKSVSDDLPTVVNMSTGISTENDAQYAGSVDKGDKGDIIQSSQETENSNADRKTVNLSEVNKSIKFGEECPVSSNGSNFNPIISPEQFFMKVDTGTNHNVEIGGNYNDSNKIFEQIPNSPSNNGTSRDEKPLDSVVKPLEPSVSIPVSSLPRDLATTSTIYRIGHSDIFGCRNCKVKGDKFFMEEHACKPSKFRKDLPNLHILDLIKCKYEVLCDKDNNRYYAIPAYPAKGVLYVTEKSPDYISGEVRMRGRNGGSYPYKLPELINNLFGEEKNAIEVCSGSINGRNASSSPSAPFTVDVNPAKNPDYVGDARLLKGIANGTYSRWMGDPPYNHKNAKKMYGTELPSPIRLLDVLITWK